MSIYTISSERPAPYVYIGIHPITGEFYIGSRTAKNIECSHLDLRSYKTSSPGVKKRFDEFSWSIIAEFFSCDAAYDFEQELISCTWNEPGSLNNSCYYGKRRFRMNGPRSKEHSAKIGLAQKGKTISNEQRANSSNFHKGKKLSEETRAKMSASKIGKLHTEESKQKMRKPRGPHTDETKAKISAAASVQARNVQRIVTCPHCGKQGGAGTMPRWHFDRCRML
jgi:hypothetical protein